jgi:hypothetical protein
MASTETKNDTPPIDAAFEHIKELNEQLLAGTREVRELCLDSYEKTVERAVDLELKLAGLTQQEWLQNVIEMQAEITREFTATYTSALRNLLK